ncbi:MAG: PKHD-type hydroxylase Bphy [Betaproteobacteria bacterium]|nr:PKHD-type hydroxylase Bphy [Betaproteobacteria bacterium]
MLTRIPKVLNAEQLQYMRERLAGAREAWVDGRATAGHQGAQVKHNLQIAEGSEVGAELGQGVLAALERQPLFISAALPHRIYPPMFNRYEGQAGMHFGNHVDGSVRLIPGSGEQIRTDLSATLFISSPEDYDGGELIVQDAYGEQRVKLPAGDMVLYPATSLHRVTPVTRGARVASFFWIQSMVRDDGQRALLFDLDMSVVRLTQDAPGHDALVSLTGCYHNLLRMWADV